MPNKQQFAQTSSNPQAAIKAQLRGINFARQKPTASKQSAPSKTQPQASSKKQTSAQSANSAWDNYPNTQIEESLVAPGMYKPLPEETLFQWQAPERPFKKRNKKYFSTVFVIALLVSLILAFAGQLVAIAVVLAVAFVVYALSVVPPQNLTYKISTYGVRIESNLYYWEELGRFWFTDKYDQNILNIETVRFPGRITVLLGDQKKEIIELILAEVLLQQKPELTLYEKASAWLQEKIPLDAES